MTIVYVSFHRAQNRGSRSLRIKIKRRQDGPLQKRSAKKDPNFLSAMYSTTFRPLYGWPEKF
jgi:hypothetical protein